MALSLPTDRKRPMTLGEYLMLSERNGTNEQVVVMFKGALKTMLVKDQDDYRASKIRDLPITETTDTGGARAFTHEFTEEELTPGIGDPHFALIKLGCEMLDNLPTGVTCCNIPVFTGHDDDDDYTFQWVVYR